MGTFLNTFSTSVKGYRPERSHKLSVIGICLLCNQISTTVQFLICLSNDVDIVPYFTDNFEGARYAIDGLIESNKSSARAGAVYMADYSSDLQVCYDGLEDRNMYRKKGKKVHANM